MYVWVTGAKGLLGSSLVEHSGIPVMGTGREGPNLTQKEEVERFLEEHPQITHIVNGAALSQVELAEQVPLRAFEENSVIPGILGEVASQRGLFCLHISSDYVFGGEGRTPLKEGDPTTPCNLYGRSKLLGEEKFLTACPQGGVLRVSWLFGGRGKGKNFIAKLLALFSTDRQVRLTHDQWGRPTYVQDVVPVIFSLLERRLQGIYHFANAGVATKYEFGRAMYEEAKRVGLPLKTEEILPVPAATFPSLVKRPVYSAFDTTKIEGALHLRPRLWRDALKEEMELYAAATSCL